jgi:uncharacterized membrane protein YpjA
MIIEVNRNAGLWGWIWSEQVLFSTTMLWLLFWINLGGTLYGYVWYWDQLVLTYESMNGWLLLFVPDSPTASLFFTLSLGFMIMDRSMRVSRGLLNDPAMKALRGFIDAFAIITLVKYGIWAVTMNFADGYQGGGIAWQQWMLIVSHTGMAVQAILYAKQMRYSLIAVATVAVWTFTNDYLDYHAMIHPWLYGPLEDDLAVIEAYTIMLSFICIAIALFAYYKTAMKEKL